MSATKSSSYPAPGMVVENVGVMYGTTFASPAYFAEAWVGFPGIQQGITKREFLIRELEKVARQIPSAKDAVKKHTPVLFHLLTAYPLSHDPRRRAVSAYEHLRQWLINEKGTAKLLDSYMVDLNTRGHLGSYSVQDNAGVKVLSREIHDPAIVRITNPFATDIAQAVKTEFGGGTIHGDFSVRHSRIFSDKLRLDAAFLNSLRPHHRAQYGLTSQVIEFARASAITALAYARSDKRLENLIGGDGQVPADAAPVIAYDFSSSRDLALNAVAYKIAPKQVRIALGLAKTDTVPYRELDQDLLGKGVENSGDVTALLARGLAARSVLVSERNFGEYWPIIQALAHHMHTEFTTMKTENGEIRQSFRAFRGTTLELNGATTSLVYNFARHSGKNGKDVSARIVFGGPVGLPKVMYKTTHPRETEPSDLSHFNVFDFVNLPNGVRKAPRQKTYREIDWRTNQLVNVSIFQPTPHILKRAEEYHRIASQTVPHLKRVVTADEWQARYIKEYKANR